MPVNPGLLTVIPSGPYYRITSLSFETANPADHRLVVDGQGSRHNSLGARYNYPGAVTVYLTEDIETCFAEKMFYFHREVVRGIDEFHNTGVIPPFNQLFVLWEVMLDKSIEYVFDMNIHGAFFGIFPSLTLNPSQDYKHLKQKRAEIEPNGYEGIRVASSRARRRGNLVVLFQDQSSNVKSISPYRVEYRLIQTDGRPFINHATEILDFTTGEVRIRGGTLPTGGGAFSSWQRVDFNH